MAHGVFVAVFNENIFTAFKAVLIGKLRRPFFPLISAESNAECAFFYNVGKRNGK